MYNETHPASLFTLLLSFFILQTHLSRLRLLVVSLEKSLSLLVDALCPSLSSGSVPHTASLSLLLKRTLASLLGLGLDNVLNDLTLVLESVTLGELVKLVVKMLVDLACSAVLGEQTTENTLAAHPHDLARHTGVLGTLSLTETGVTTSTLSLKMGTGARARVDGDGLLDDQTIGDELADSLAAVGVGNGSGLAGVKPNFSLADVENARGETLL